jgi:hypothetical protein
MDVSIRGILQAHYARYAATHGMPAYIHRAAFQLSRCRTPAMGAHFAACPNGHERHIVYHSCRHRLCPRCAAVPRERWLLAMRERLIACPHWHIVFTLPHDLHPLWRFNRAWFTQALFEAVASTLSRLCTDNRHLGARPGFVLALHTWGRSLSLHPHIHALVTDGGLDAQAMWQRPRRSCFLPARVVTALFRGRLCAQLREALREEALSLPPSLSTERALSLVNRLCTIKWNVYLCQRYAHGEGVMTYLARYVRGGMLKDAQLCAADDGHVAFRYRAHNDQGKTLHRLSLETDQFLSRYLQHTPLPRSPVVRHYGLYANRNANALTAARHAHSQAPARRTRIQLDAQSFCITLARGPSAATHCRVCGERLRRMPIHEALPQGP